MIDTSHGVWSTLKNGLRRKCPHCGQASLLMGWVTVRHECPVCGLAFERNAGDTWAFWIIGDRIPIGAAIAVLYIGFRPQTWLQTVVFGGALAAALIGTIPHRRGVVIALDYLSRRWWPDPNDILPSAPLALPADGSAPQSSTPSGRSTQLMASRSWPPIGPKVAAEMTTSVALTIDTSSAAMKPGTRLP